jgi:hypothetical protein
MARRAHAFFALGSALALVSAASACRPDTSSGSQIQTVDNFAAAGEVRTNACRVADDAETAEHRFNPKYKKKIHLADADIATPGASAERRAQLLDTVKIALSAVPQWSQDVLVANKGQILVTPKAKSICTNGMKDEKTSNYVPQSAKDGVDACIWLDATDPNHRVLSVVLLDQEKTISSALVRTFGFLHVQYYPRLRMNIGARDALFVLDEVDTSETHKAKVELTRTFLRELTQSGRAASLFGVDGLQPVLGHVQKGSRSLAEQIAANVDAKDASADDEGLFANLSLTYDGEEGELNPTTRIIRGRRIVDSLAANAFDSIYCRTSDAALTDDDLAGLQSAKDLEPFTDTYSVFDKVFPKTSKYYGDEVIPAWIAASKEISRLIGDWEKADTKTQVALALTTIDKDGDNDGGDTVVSPSGETDSATSGPKTNDTLDPNAGAQKVDPRTQAAQDQANMMAMVQLGQTFGYLAMSLGRYVPSTLGTSVAQNTAPSTQPAAQTTAAPRASTPACPNGNCAVAGVSQSSCPNGNCASSPAGGSCSTCPYATASTGGTPTSGAPAQGGAAPTLPTAGMPVDEGMLSLQGA